jgi:hypothetical protein
LLAVLEYRGLSEPAFPWLAPLVVQWETLTPVTAEDAEVPPQALLGCPGTRCTAPQDEAGSRMAVSVAGRTTAIT